MILGYLTAASAALCHKPGTLHRRFPQLRIRRSHPSGRIHFMRSDVRPGMKTAADLVKAENLVVVGLDATRPRICRCA